MLTKALYAVSWMLTCDDTAIDFSFAPSFAHTPQAQGERTLPCACAETEASFARSWSVHSSLPCAPATCTRSRRPWPATGATILSSHSWP